MKTSNFKKIAEEFWSETELENTYPRPIEQAIALKLPLDIVKVCSLNMGKIEEWLMKHSIPISVPKDSREFQGCLVSHNGHGILFVCGNNNLHEQRFTIAHELAHFILDYLIPRKNAIDAFGKEICSVLDGKRNPTPAERVDAILSRITLGPHLHLLPKNNLQESAIPYIVHVEDRADYLALELVAPQNKTLEMIKDIIKKKDRSDSELKNCLSEYFCIPLYAFNQTVTNFKKVKKKPLIQDIIDSTRNNKNG